MRWHRSETLSHLVLHGPSGVASVVVTPTEEGWAWQVYVTIDGQRFEREDVCTDRDDAETAALNAMSKIGLRLEAMRS